MVKIDRILKDYREAGSVNALLALWGFVDGHAFLTKAGAIGVIYRLAGADYECLDHAERRDIARRFEQALRHLDESFRSTSLLKRPAAPIPVSRHRNPRSIKRSRTRRALRIQGRGALGARAVPGHLV